MFGIIIFAAHQSWTKFALDLLFLVDIQNVTAQILLASEWTVAMFTHKLSDSTVTDLNVFFQQTFILIFSATDLTILFKCTLELSLFMQ
jgi:hypothetical protein